MKIDKKIAVFQRLTRFLIYKSVKLPYYYLDISKISKIEMDNKVKNQIDDFLTNYYNSHTGLYLNSKEFIEDLKKVNIYV